MHERCASVRRTSEDSVYWKSCRERRRPKKNAEKRRSEFWRTTHAERRRNATRNSSSGRTSEVACWKTSRNVNER